MKALITSALFFMSFGAFADEVVGLKADMTIMKCNSTANGQDCTAPVTYGKPIQITLATSAKSTQPTGSYQFKELTDGYTFEGTVWITNMGENGTNQYFIQTMVSSVKDSDPSSLKLSYMGSVSVTDMSALNQVTFYADERKEPNMSWTPSMTIGSANSNVKNLARRTLH